MLCRRPLLALLSGSILVASCSQPPQESLSVDPEILAIWDGGEIRFADFDAHMLAQPASQRWPVKAEDAASWWGNRLDEIFLQRIYAALEESADLDEDERFRRAWTIQRRSVLAQAFFERQVGDLEVSQEEAREYFARFGHEFDVAETRILSNLLLAFPAGADEAARRAVCERAETLRRDIEAGAAFEAMARRYSASSTAANGGVIGVVRRDQLRGGVGDLVFSLGTGEVSRVARSPEGCQLFLVRQIAPAYEARFEAVLPEVMDRLRTAKRTATYLKLYRAEITALGLEAPSWNEGMGAEAFAADGVYFDLDGERVTGLDVLRRTRIGVPAAQALPQLASEMILAAAMEHAAPEEAATRAVAARHLFALQYLQHQAEQRQAEALPAEDLRRHFEVNSARFVTEPSVELTIVSWPIGAGDPLGWMERPRVFAARVEAARGRISEVWTDFAGDEGVVRRSVPVTPLRTLAQQEPQLAAQLLGDFSHGQVIGPFAAGRRLIVIVVESHLPSRSLGFIEAIDRVRADYVRQNAATLARQRVEALQQEHGFRSFDENLGALGARLLDEILQAGLGTSGDG